MAEENNSRQSSSKNNENFDNSDDSESEEPIHHIQLDLGDDFSHETESNRLGSQTSGVSGAEATKREDNPFSFKHFLRSDSGPSYQNKGARPKVYCDGRPISSISDLDFSAAASSSSSPSPMVGEMKQTRIVPEYSSALPDFVQDHLVVEQCYNLGAGINSSNITSASPNNSKNSFNLDLNLPDFTTPSSSVNINRIQQSDSASHSHVINNINGNVNGNRRCDVNDLSSIPLDLPLRPHHHHLHSQADGFPLDLPIVSGGTSSSTGARSCPTAGEVEVSKSLPDFLADGAVRTQQKSDGSTEESPERECERLRRELEVTRRQLNEQTRLVETLRHELECTKIRTEESLERSNMRASSAESTILKLRQEVKSLTVEVRSLRSENQMLREEEGAIGGGYGGQQQVPNELHSRRLAHELKAAASTAEFSLRQLLTGVDNLRIMAAALENMHKIEEKQESFSDLDEESGPAL